MTLSNEARTRLVIVNLCIWGVCAVLALGLLGGPRGLVASHLAPIGRELGGWGGLLLAASGFERESIPTWEIAIDQRAMGAARLLQTGPDSVAGEDSQWFPARLRADGFVHPVQLQLVAANGSRPLHEQTWRVRFEGGRGRAEMGEVHLVPHPTAAHAREGATRDSAHALGLLAPPHGFSTVRINGADAGIYFWSEADPAAMLAQLGYPAGAVVRPGRGSWQIAETTAPYSLARALPAETSPAVGAAVRQLDQLFELADNASDADFDRLAPQLLDVPKYLRWNALSWLLGNPGLDPARELAWYLDPVSGLLEPIVENWTPASAQVRVGATSSPLERVREPRIRRPSRLSLRLLRNPQHRADRNQLLWSWVTADGDNIVSESERRFGDSLTRLARADVSLARFWDLRSDADQKRRSRQALAERKARVRRALAHAEIQAHTAPGVDRLPSRLAVDLEPHGLAGIHLSELRLEMPGAVEDAAGPATLRLLDPSGALQRLAQVEPVVAGSAMWLRPDHFDVAAIDDDASARSSTPWRLEIDLPRLRAGGGPEAEPLLLELAFRNNVTGEALPTARLSPRRVDPEPTNADDIARASQDDRNADDWIRESGLPFALEADTLVLPTGSYELAETLVVPAKWRLRLEPGVRLQLAAGVGIVTFRGLTAKGTRFDPIEIAPTDPSRAWGAIGIVRAPEISEIEFMAVSGGSKLRLGGLEFDGQLSFNASDFTVADSELRDSKLGDGITARRSEFSVRRTRFENNANDGLESEQSDGEIAHCVFVDNGDDGLDSSDSRLDVSDSNFGGMRDKAVSADARSVITVVRSQLEFSEIAIASKNGSRVDTREAVFRRNRLGFAVYRDRPLFAGGLGTVVGGRFESNDRDYSVEPGSELELIGVRRGADHSLRRAWESFVRSPVVSWAARNQSSMLYSSTPSNGKNRY